MSSSSNQSDLGQADTDNALDDRLESLMADMEQELQRLNTANTPEPEQATQIQPVAETTPTQTVSDGSNEDDSIEDEDTEASAAQLMRDLNDALAEAEARDKPDSIPPADTSNDTPAAESQTLTANTTDDLETLDESLAARASTESSADDDEAPAPEHDELTEALLEADSQPHASALSEESFTETEVSTAPPRSHADHPEQQHTPPAPTPEPSQQSTAADPPAVPISPPKPETIPLTTRLRTIAVTAARILSLPLAILPPAVRDYIGWFGIITLINAGALWTFWLLFRA